MSSEVTLSPENIPGANLSESYEGHTISALRLWLLCKGNKARTSWKKQELISRYITSLNLLAQHLPFLDPDPKGRGQYC